MHEVRTVHPITHRGEGHAGNPPWRAPGRGSLGQPFTYSKCSLGTELQKGWSASISGEGAEKHMVKLISPETEISSKSTLVPQVQEEWISDCAPRSIIKRKPNLKFGKQQKLIFHLN